MSKPKSWHVFKHENLDRPRNIRTAKLWLENGTIRGVPVRNDRGEITDVLVDMDHWRASFDVSARDAYSEAVELFK